MWLMSVFMPFNVQLNDWKIKIEMCDYIDLEGYLDFLLEMKWQKAAKCST